MSFILEDIRLGIKLENYHELFLYASTVDPSKPTGIKSHLEIRYLSEERFTGSVTNGISHSVRYVADAC